MRASTQAPIDTSIGTPTERPTITSNDGARRAILHAPLIARGAAILLLACTAVFLSACTLRGPGGVEFELSPFAGPNGPSAPVVIGYYRSPQTGEIVELLDFDGDGVPDAVRLADGTILLINAGEPVDMILAGLLDAQRAGETPGDPIDGEEFGIGEPGAQGRPLPVLDLPLVPSGIFPPVPVDLGGSAAELIRASGLDIRPGEVTTLTDAITLHAFDTRTWSADLTVRWTTALAFPDLRDYEGLDYELHVKTDERADAPAFVSIRIAGDVRDVASYLHALGGRALTLEADGSTWTIRMDDREPVADLSENGEPRLRVRLDS